MAYPSCQLGTWFAAAALSLATGAAIAQEPDDCGHPVPERSIRACSALIAQDPADPHRLATLLIERGAHYIVLGDFAAALADLDRAVAVEPGNPAALQTRGDAFSRRAGVTEFIVRWDAAARRDKRVGAEQDQGRRSDYQRSMRATCQPTTAARWRTARWATETPPTAISAMRRFPVRRISAAAKAVISSARWRC